MSSIQRNQERKQKRIKLRELREQVKKHPPCWYTYHCYKPQTDKDRDDVQEMFKSLKLSYLYNKTADDYKGLIMGTLGMPSKIIKRQSDGVEIGKVYPTTQDELQLFKKFYSYGKEEIEQERKEPEEPEQETPI